jgi:lipopolysaccharide/colanic/teichoic acid biosynthesis glycosyltransferase
MTTSPDQEKIMMYALVKRVIDILGSIFLGIIFLPVCFVTALAITIDSHGPVFADTPKRVGKNGKLFKLFKFRSMVVNAHQITYGSQICETLQ